VPSLFYDNLWIVAGALMVLAAVALWLRRRPWRGARVRYPVLLAHGLLGFGSIGVGSVKQDYFRGVADHLRRLGVTVYHPRVPLVGSVAERAEALAAAVRELPEARVNIIAHSMGGLDARYAISLLGLAGRVASLTTVGTPHHGTPVADAGTALFGPMRKLFAGAGMGAFTDLTSEALVAFNRDVGNARGVQYGCVVASLRNGDAVHPLLQPTKAFLDRQGHASDGVVPAPSQRWGRVVARIHADHWAEIGWSAGLDAPTFYEKLLRKLRARGC
jgi:triacylglycerol lipase